MKEIYCLYYFNQSAISTYAKAQRAFDEYFHHFTWTPAKRTPASVSLMMIFFINTIRIVITSYNISFATL
jgi:hypothetical protein